MTASLSHIQDSEIAKWLKHLAQDQKVLGSSLTLNLVHIYGVRHGEDRTYQKT